MLGQASVPLVGIVDTAVIGRTGDVVALAGVALGATIIMLVFWTFGFLRMGMTGLTAQAAGADDRREVEALLLRALVIGLALGAVLFALHWPISELALRIMSGSDPVNVDSSAYMQARFYGAPAALAGYAIVGWLLGLGATRAALGLQIAMNVVNITLDIWFVWGMDLGAYGVGLGTALAEWSALLIGLMLVGRVAIAGTKGVRFAAMVRRAQMAELLDKAKLTKLFAINRDIMIRTIALLILFSWFANAGARLGAVALAANHVLLQMLNVGAHLLDAFAYTAEERVGQAIGARDRQRFLRAIRLTGEFSLVSGIVLSGVLLVVGGWLVELIAIDPEVRAEASRYLVFAALIPLLGMPSWLLDGIFIGATRGAALRNAALITTVLYIALDLALRDYGNLGVWLAISASYLLRATALGAHFPRLLRDIDWSDNPQSRPH